MAFLRNNSLFIVVCVLFLSVTHASYGQKSKLKNKLDSVKFELKSLEYERLLMQGSLYKNKEDYAQSIEYFDDAISIMPQGSVAYYQLASIYKIQNKFNDSEKNIKKAIKNNPQQLDYHYFLADLYEENGDYEKQIVELKFILKNYPDNLKLLYQIVEIYYNYSQYNKSLETLNEAEKQFGNNEEIMQKRFQIYYVQKNFEKAKSQLLQLIESYPFKHEYSLYLVSLYLTNNYYDKALEVSNSLESQLTDNSDLLEYKATIFNKKQQADSLINVVSRIFGCMYINNARKTELFDKYIFKNDEFEEVYNQRYKIVQNFLILYPEDEQLHLVMADYFLDKKDPIQALPHMYYAIKLDKSNITLYNKLIEQEQKYKNWDSVISISKIAKKYFPNNAELYLVSGNAYLQIKKYEDAINTLIEGVDVSFLRKQKKAFYISLGEAYFYMDSLAKSKEFLNQALLIDSVNAESLYRIAYIFAKQKSEIETAQKLLNICYTQDSTMQILHVIQAQLYIQQNDNEKALLEIEKAQNNLETGLFYENYGDILFLNNKQNEAELAWIKANELGAMIDIQRKKVFLQKKINEK